MKKINTNLLTKIARKSNRVQRHASIIFHSGNPIAFGYNDIDEHAEEDAIFNVPMMYEKNRNEFRSGLTMVNIRLTKGNRIALSKPCPACLDLLKEKKFRKVIYSNNKGGFDEIYL